MIGFAKFGVALLCVALAACNTPTNPDPSTHSPLDKVTDLRILSVRAAPERDAATISWETSEQADATVYLYQSLAPTRTVRVNSSGTAGNVRLENLAPGTNYQFAVRVENAGRSATTDLQSFRTLELPDGRPLSQLVSISFSMLEVSFNSRWLYAPFMTVRETTGESTATVTKIAFQIPGFGAIPAYSTSKCVKPSEERALFSIILDDFEFSIDNAGGRAAGTTATATVTYVDREGRQGELHVSGPIVPASFPSGYQGGTSTWPCGQPGSQGS